MTITKHHNFDYSGGSPDIPKALGDRYFGQDLGRDFYYLLDRIGIVAKDLYLTPPFIISGGRCSQGAGTTLNITACIGVVNFSVKVPNVWGVTPPPTVTTETIITRVESTAQTNLVPDELVDDDPIYIKLKYKNLDGSSRTKSFSGGSYVYNQSPSFEFVVDTVAPAGDGTELLLDVFTSHSDIFTFTKTRNNEYPQLKR